MAIGEIFYKMAALYALAMTERETRDALGPHQFAMAPGGAETAINYIQTAMELHPDWVVVSCDITNAFNSRSRKDILDELYKRKKLRNLWSITNWGYGNPSELCIMREGKTWKRIFSSQGVKQGDALSSFLFALSMVDIFGDTMRKTKCLSAALQDDYYILGPADEVIKAWRILTNGCGGPTGIEINGQKSMALVPDQKTARMFENEGLPTSMTLMPALGAVLTRDENMASKWLAEESKNKHDSMFEMLMDRNIPAQVAFLLLKMSMAPAVNFWLRTNRPSRTQKMAGEFDHKMIKAAKTILNIPNLSNEARKQLVLPIDMGGFGLRSAAAAAGPAWLSGIAQAMGACRSLTGRNEYPGGKFMEEIEDISKGILNMEMKTHIPIDGRVFWDTFGEQPAQPGLQRDIMEGIIRKEHEKLMKRWEKEPRELARMVGLQNKESGLWLATMPTHVLLRMRDAAFQSAAKVRLGVPLVTGVEKCACGMKLDGAPLHLLSCRQLVATMTLRHNRVLATLMTIAELGMITAKKEVTVDEKGRKRTDGMMVVKGIPTMIDVSIICPTASTYVKAAKKAKGAALLREKQKEKKYEREVANAGMDFFPFVIESTGGFGGKVGHMVGLMTEEIMANNAEVFIPGNVATFIKKAVAVSVQVGNALVIQEGVRKAKGRGKLSGTIRKFRARRGGGGGGGGGRRRGGRRKKGRNGRIDSCSGR